MPRAVFHKIVLALIISHMSVGAAFAQFKTDRLMMTGRSALYYEDYVLSIQYFNQAINAKPYLYEPWFYRGLAKFYLDDFSGAEADVSEAIKLNPYINNMYELRGLCHIRQNKFADAITDYDHSLKLNPHNQGNWYNRILCRIELKDYDKAQCELDTMIVKWKKFPDSYSLTAEIYLQQKDTVEADKWLDKALEMNPYNSEAWTARAMIALTRKKWKDADAYLSKAIHLKPQVVGNYINRAMVRINTNNLRGAMSDYDMAIQLNPENFLAHYNRGLLRVQIGDDNRAIEDFDFIIKNEPDNLMAIYNRALLHDKTGNPRAAISDYSKLIDIFPNFWAGLAARARCYRLLGMTAKAELDEFRIFKAQMDKHVGIQPRWTKGKIKQLRKRSEIDFSKYDQIVVEDEEKPVHEFKYKTEYRGRVQHRQAEDHFMPMYALSTKQYSNGVKSYQAFSEEVERYNNSKGAQQKLYVSCRQQKIDATESRQLTNFTDSLSKKIEQIHDSHALVPLLIQRAVAYTALYNLDAAINDLIVCLQIDSTAILPRWQKGVCEAMLANTGLSQSATDMANTYPANALTIEKAIDDTNEAIKLSPANPYLYYNRANLYAMQNNYTKAIIDYTKAIELNSAIPEAYYNRGLARIHANNIDAGIQDLSTAGELGLYEAYGTIKRYTAKKNDK